MDDNPSTVVDKMVVVISELLTVGAVGDTSSASDFDVDSCVIVSEPLSVVATSNAAVVDNESCVDVVVLISPETVVEDEGTLGVTFSSTVVGFSTLGAVVSFTARGVDVGVELEIFFVVVVDGDDVDGGGLCSSV